MNSGLLSEFPVAPELFKAAYEKPEKKTDSLEGLPAGQISGSECRMLYTLAAESWTGQGEIVEVGSLYGKSTVCLARGMRDNARKTTGKLHAFDKWMADDETEYMLGQLTEGYRGSFRHVFDQNTADYNEWIVPHEGDVLDAEWCGKPIEILFIDCSVSREFHEVLFRKFFPFLRRGSVLIHQDYFFYRSYYLPLMMARLSPFLPELSNFDTSMVYEMTKPIPQELFNAPLVESGSEIVWSLEELIRVYGGPTTQHGAIIATMLVYFFQITGNAKRAENLASQVQDGRGDQTDRQWMPIKRNLAKALAGV